VLATVIRFVISAIVLLAVGYLLPGVSVFGFWGALLAALVIAGLGYLAEAIFGDKVSPQNRGIVGFITAAVVIYVAQFIVPALQVSILGAVLAALVIGIIDMFVPTELR